MANRERWDRDRSAYERERDRERDRYDDNRSQAAYTSGGRGPPSSVAPRERSLDRYERVYRASDDDFVRDRRYRDDDRPLYRRDPAPPSSAGLPPQEYERRVVFEENERERDRGDIRDRERDRERERDFLYRRDSPPPQLQREREPAPQQSRRPATLLRRQSSLDTFDRRPPARFWEREERELYGPPARREDVRPPPPREYVPQPLPRTKALPPPRRYAEREFYEEIKVADPDYYGDEDFHYLSNAPPPPAPPSVAGPPVAGPLVERERVVREKEVVRRTGRRRDRSRESRATGRSYSHRGSSRSSSSSSRSSNSSGGTRVRNEYPKKGKTKIPARLVSTRALIELGYPFIEEGNIVIVLKALGQDNIDELLKLSREHQKTEKDIAAYRADGPTTLVEERREQIIYDVPAPPPPAPVFIQAPPQPAPVIIEAGRPGPAPYEVVERAPFEVVERAPYEVVNTTTAAIVRDVSPARTVTSVTTSRAPYYVTTDQRGEFREVSDEVVIGPLALAQRPRSRSRPGREIRAEIRALESELRSGSRHRHSHSHGHEVVRSERLPTGEVVLYEERVEKIEEGKRGVRIEKDKKGRMSISVPKNR